MMTTPALYDVPETAGRTRHGAEAVELLLRVQNTLTSDVKGLLAPSALGELVEGARPLRPIVSSGQAIDLRAGKLVYPKLVQRPATAVQAAEKTESPASGKMRIDEVSINAGSYSGSGDLSWQTAKWSTPDALKTWLKLGAESYVLGTEQAAAAVLVAGATGGPVAVTANTLAAWGQAVATASALVRQSIAKQPATDLYLDPETAATLIGLIATISPAQTDRFAGLAMVISDALPHPTAIVGAGSMLIVGERPGEPVSLAAAEPAIGGIEVGVIGSFAASVADGDAFVVLTVP
jgi:hypothetical protein